MHFINFHFTKSCFWGSPESPQFKTVKTFIILHYLIKGLLPLWNCVINLFFSLYLSLETKQNKNDISCEARQMFYFSPEKRKSSIAHFFPPLQSPKKNVSHCVRRPLVHKEIYTYVDSVGTGGKNLNTRHTRTHQYWKLWKHAS